jgi:hypothetical protein
VAVSSPGRFTPGEKEQYPFNIKLESSKTDMKSGEEEHFSSFHDLNANSSVIHPVG